jgi:hypothetical protein
MAETLEELQKRVDGYREQVSELSAMLVDMDARLRKYTDNIVQTVITKILENEKK